MTLTDSLNAEAVRLGIIHDTALELARVYTMRVDIAVMKGETKVITDIGPKLHALLKDLGMLPVAAATDTEGGAANDNPDPAAATFAALRAQYN